MIRPVEYVKIKAMKKYLCTTCGSACKMKDITIGDPCEPTHCPYDPTLKCNWIRLGHK